MRHDIVSLSGSQEGDPERHFDQETVLAALRKAVHERRIGDLLHFGAAEENDRSGFSGAVKIVPFFDLRDRYAAFRITGCLLQDKVIRFIVDLQIGYAHCCRDQN